MATFSKINGHEVKDATARGDHEALVKEVNNLVDEINNALEDLETKLNNSGYTLPVATSSARGGIKIGYTASGANIPVQLSSEKAYVALTKSSVTSALGYTPLSTGGGTLNTGATLKFDTYGTRFLTISGNSISADMSKETGGWAGAFATVKDPSSTTTTMLGWYGNASGLTHIFMGGTYSDPALKMTPTGQFTFKNTPKVGTTSVALTSDIPSLSNYSTLANTIKSLSISGKTITYTKGDGTTGTLTTQDTNTTYTLSSFGITATATELNYTDGVTSNIQTQLDNKLGKSSKAADSSKLEGKDASYYLNYENFENTPEIPTNVVQSTDLFTSYANDGSRKGKIIVSDVSQTAYDEYGGDRSVKESEFTIATAEELDSIGLQDDDYSIPTSSLVKNYVDEVAGANGVEWSDISGKPSFATVATSGSYNDLKNKPTIPAAYTLPTASSSTLGGVKTTSTVTSTSGLTACPIISGVPYYKDTNTNTNYYHTTGSWSGLTYTATANGGAGALAFTIPTGTTSTTVAVGNHTHSYLPLSGGTITGNVLLSNSNAQGSQPNFKWKTINSKTPYVGYCTSSTDGTFVVASLAGTAYNTGLSIGGSSGNLLWKGTKIATISDIPSVPTVSVTQKLTSGTEIGSVTVGSTTTKLYAPTASSVDLSGYTTNANNPNLSYYATDNGSTTAGTWIAKCGNVTSLFDGLSVKYKVTVAGATTTTFNLNSLGAKTVYLRGTTKLTTHYAVNTMINLIYSTSTGAWYVADYDANSDTKVTQAYRTTNENRPILMTAGYTSASTSGSSATTAYWNPNVYINPSTGVLTANGLSIQGQKVGRWVQYTMYDFLVKVRTQCPAGTIVRLVPSFGDGNLLCFGSTLAFRQLGSHIVLGKGGNFYVESTRHELDTHGFAVEVHKLWLEDLLYARREYYYKDESNNEMDYQDELLLEEYNGIDDDTCEFYIWET